MFEVQKHFISRRVRDIMAKDEPLLRDLRHEDTYRVVEAHILMPKIAEMFAIFENSNVDIVAA